MTSLGALLNALSLRLVAVPDLAALERNRARYVRRDPEGRAAPRQDRTTDGRARFLSQEVRKMSEPDRRGLGASQLKKDSTLRHRL